MDPGGHVLTQVLALAVVAGVTAAWCAWVGMLQHRRAGSRPVPTPPITPRDLDTAERVLIVSASIGAGHDGAADELGRRMVARGARVDRCDFLDLLPPGLGGLVRSAYHRQLDAVPDSWGWLLRRLESSPSLHMVGGLFAGLARRRLLERIEVDTDLVLTTYPLAAHAIGRRRLDGSIRCSSLTFLTDMSVHPLWITPGVDSHAALHHVPAMHARLLGAADVRVHGPAVPPRFHPASLLERAAARSSRSLEAEGCVALVVAGSWGVGDIAQTVHDLQVTELVTPLVVCGQNDRLRRQLTRAGVTALGWVADMATLMRACDVVIQNAGGLTSLEARAVGLPVITYRPLPGHGWMNAAALEEAGWAFWARELTELRVALATAVATDLATDLSTGLDGEATLAVLP